MLLSTEVIQLFCIVPSFYDYLSTSQGIFLPSSSICFEFVLFYPFYFKELNEVLEMSLGAPHFYQAVLNFLNDLRHQNVKIELIEIGFVKFP